jgi:hypothetical protein
LNTVSLQVVPNDVGAYPSMEGAFLILTVPEGEDPSVLYVEYVTGSLQVEKPEEVAEARLKVRPPAIRGVEPVGLGGPH